MSEGQGRVRQITVPQHLKPEVEEGLERFGKIQSLLRQIGEVNQQSLEEKKQSQGRLLFFLFSFFWAFSLSYIDMKERIDAQPPGSIPCSLLLAFQSCFTRPSFRSFWAVVCAWILCSGRRSLTRVIQAAQLSQFKHCCSFHRFFSKARWNLDELGHAVLRLLLPFCSQVLVAAVDDTLARKSGRRIWGADMHHDPLRSTRARPAFSFSYNWVVFSLHISFPFAPHKHWALPILVRLYRKKRKEKVALGRWGKWERKETGQASPKQYRTRPQLALQIIQIVAGWVPDRLLYVTGDSEYAGKAISRHLPPQVHLISRMPMDAALYEPPPPNLGGRGRPRNKGKRLPSPQQMAADDRLP